MELYPWQEKDRAEAVDALETFGGACLAWGMGSGKGHPLDEPILTPTGWVPVGELNPSDAVIGADGRAIKVTAVHDRGVLPTYLVTFTDGASVRVDADHIWTMERSDAPRSDWTTRELINMSARNRGRYSVPLTGPVEHPEADLILDPYLLGALLADGYLHGAGVQWTKTDPNVIREFQSSVERSGLRYSKWRGIQHGVSGAGKALETLGLRVRSKDKFIPEQYLTASLEQRKSLINGLFDGDGGFRPDRGTAYYTTSSERLAHDVQNLIWSLGEMATLHTIHHPKGDYFQVSLFGELNPFRAIDHPVTGGRRGRKRTIKSIERVEDQFIRCISVSAEDQLYVTKDYIVTHNTVTAVEVAKSVPHERVLIVAPLSTHPSWAKTAQEQGAPTVTKAGNGNKAEKEALFGLEFGVPGWYVVGPAFLTRANPAEWPEFDLVIVDECFIAGTKVDTPNGPKSIETLREGDTVYGYDHKTGTVVETLVTGVMKKESYSVLPTGATANHPYYVIGDGYRPAADLTREDYVYVRSGETVRAVRADDAGAVSVKSTEDVFYRVREQAENWKEERSRRDEEVRGVRGRVSGSTLGQEEVLFPRVLEDSNERTLVRGGEGAEDGVHYHSEPVSGPGEREKGSRNEESERSDLRAFNRGQRRSGPVRGVVEGGTSTGVGDAVRGSAGSWIKSEGVPVSLQDRLGTAEAEDRSGGGREEPQDEVSENAGPEEGRGTHSEGVDDLAILEPRDPARYRRVRSSYSGGSPETVYNLETGASNFFANGVLVHNCHQITEKTSKGLKKLLTLDSPRRLALSGTPARNKVENLWGLNRFLSPNRTLPSDIADPNFYRWAESRLVMKMIYTSQKDQWGNAKKAKTFEGEREPGTIFRQMPHVSVHLARERCCDAPEHENGVLGNLSEPIVIEEVIPLLPEQKKIIRDMETQMVSWLEGHPLVADIPLTAQQRIRQAVLGVPTVTWTDDDEPVQEVSFDLDCKSPFLDRALEVIRDLDGEPVIVWTDSAKFADVIHARLTKAGVKADQYRGSRKADISRFGTDYQVLVAVPSSFGTGSDGAQRVCSNEIWISRDLDSTTNLQSEARLMRNGQTATIRRWLFWDDRDIAKGQYSSAVTRQLELNRSLKVVH